MTASFICFIWRDLSCLSWNELIYKATEAKNMKQNDIWQRAKNSIFACEVINYSVWNRFHWYLQQTQSMAASLICFIWRDLSCVSWNELINKATEAINMKQNDIWQSAKNSIFRLWSHQLQCMKPIPLISAASKEYSSTIHMFYWKGSDISNLQRAHL